jgi:hypothetical protein
VVRPRGTSCFPLQAVRVRNTKLCGLLNELREVPPIVGWVGEYGSSAILVWRDLDPFFPLK